MTVTQVMEWTGTAVDAAGVAVIVAGVAWATFKLAFRRSDEPYRMYRQEIARAILLGLEFLIAGDIIRTVVVSPTIERVLSLTLIVLIRTVLSFTLEVEIEGRWPWQANGGGHGETAKVARDSRVRPTASSGRG